MDDEIEDIVGDVKYTDSQKSVATTNVYSQDFTDSSSDKNNSSGKETYVIECDSDDSEALYHLHDKESVIKVTNKSGTNRSKLTNDKLNSYDSAVESAETRANDNRLTELNNTRVQCDPSIGKATATNLQRCSFISETFTQTSKTIFEIAQAEGGEKSEYKAIETQTSCISFTENKTIEYRIEVSGSHTHFTRNEISKGSHHRIENVTLQNDYDQKENCLEIVEPLLLSPIETDDSNADNLTHNPDRNFNDILKIMDEVPKDKDENQQIQLLDNTSEYENTSKFDSENDSLQDDEYDAKIDNRDNVSETSVSKSVDNDVEELYNHLSKSLDLRTLDRPNEYDITRFTTLTPLTEESTAVKVDSIADIKSSNFKTEPKEDANENIIFTKSSGVRFKMLPKDEEKKEPFKLPPIHNQSCPSSPHLNSLFGNASNKVAKAGHMPSLFECVGDSWEIGTKDLAAAESTRINGRIEPVLDPNSPCHLPSIYIEGVINYGDSTTIDSSRHVKSSIISSESPRETICIQEKIRELKMSKSRKQRLTKYSSTTAESRSASPGSASPDEGHLCDVVERGCEALCTTVIKKLCTQCWYEVVEVLEELPKILDKFWCVITEQRIADLIRQVNVHVDSPRTQVARTACNTLAAILKNTNYTKKPDFYEAVTSLLVKTGSFSKPVRRAANVALDDIVCGVELSHSVTALCVHGVSHKSPLVRCAAARLLVVCAALSGGGRELLRARPPTAAHARRNALRALSALLDDKNTDTRKYAERLYSMLRPLANFEAYYLTDVDVDVASKQMKKYDQHLLCGPPKETR